MAEVPLTLDSLVDYGAFGGFIPPVETFDPDGAWENRYRVWLYSASNQGTMRLTRSATPPSQTGVLNVEQSVIQSPGSVHQTSAQIQFVADALSTPQSWQIDSVILDLNSQPIEKSRVLETGSVTGGQIQVIANGRTLLRPAPAVFTSNWSLFDAVQRLPGPATTPLEFDLLEELDLLKTGQRLSYQESRTLDVNGNNLSLIGYHLIGEGILPYEFWVDEQHRLLIALSGLRAYIYDRIRIEKFRETWNAASIPQTFAPGSSGAVAGADKSWSYTVQANAGALSIEEETPGGSRRLKAAGGGGLTANQAFFSSNDASLDFDSVGTLTIKATITLNATGTDTPRTTWIAFHDGNASITGFLVQFNACTANAPLSLQVFVNGVKTAVTAGTKGAQQAGETYSITVTFTRSGANTAVDYQVEKASGGNLVAPGTKTITGATLPAGVTLHEVELTFLRLAACAVDDIVIEA